MDYYSENGSPKGEIVLVIGGKTDEQNEWTTDALYALIRKTLKKLKTKGSANRLSLFNSFILK